jgi:hypothetical protein
MSLCRPPSRIATRHGELRFANILLEEADVRAGWAVFTGCEGDDPHFHAFFPARVTAERYLATCRSLGPDHDAWLCDADIAPASIVDGRIVTANSFDWVEGSRRRSSQLRAPHSFSSD